MVGSPNVYADILHVTGFKVPDAIVCMQHGNRKYMVVPPMEIGRAREENKKVISLTPRELGLDGKARRQLSEWAYALAKHVGVRSVMVPGVFPVSVARALENKGMRVHVAKQSLLPERQVKTKAELEKIRFVQRATVKAMRYAFSVIEQARVDGKGQLRDGAVLLTSEGLRRKINHMLLEFDCFGGETIAACGPRSSGPHYIGAGPLLAGQPIILDIFPRHLQTGYWGDLTRTVAKGYASPELVRMHRVVKQVQEEALARVRAGISGDEIHAQVTKSFACLGFPGRVGVDGVPEGFTHGTGHGVGLDVHEAPSLSIGGGRLRSGNVVTVEPGLYYKAIGGVRIEDTVVVTRSGCEVLATCPKGLIIS
jgi:Xaa-Pro aminopeptidase